MKTMLLKLAVISIVLFANSIAFTQPSVQIYATGFVNPIGLEIDGAGNLWVGEQGTGSGNTARVSMVTPNGQVYPFLVDLPSTAPAFEPVGAQDVYFDIDGKLLVMISNDAGSDSLCGRVLFVDTTEFIPGGTPFNRNNIVSSFDIGSIFPGQNPFKITVGPDNDLFVVDASANAIARWDRSNGTLSSFAIFAPIGQSEAVPTGIVYTGSNFYVGTLTGLPVPIGAAKIYNVDLSGNKTIYQDGLTCIIDVAISPIDGALYAIQHAEFGPPWLNNKGRLFRIHNGVVDTLLSDMPRPSGMVFNSNGDLFISSFSSDNIVKVSNLSVVPVELTSFSASISDSKVTLDWSTATELNNNGFEVQRKSVAGDFATIGFVKGAGTSTNQHNYSFTDKDLVAGNYSYRLKQIDYDGKYEYSKVIEADVRPLDNFTLEQNYPNPFNPSTTIGYILNEKGNIKLTLYNAIGKEIAVLVNEEQDKGYHKTILNAENLASGVYFYKLQAGSLVETKKMLLMK